MKHKSTIGFCDKFERTKSSILYFKRRKSKETLRKRHSKDADWDKCLELAM
jgi:hypothetical protein